MSVHNYEHQISYFSVPKCACTSLKNFFFEIENGFEFRTYRANGRWKHIHNAAYGTREFREQPHKQIRRHWKVAILRDPIERVLSCYSNRVLHHGELDRLELSPEDQAAGLTLRPDLQTFVAHLRRYAQLSQSVDHHTGPMTKFLGTDTGYFDRLYKMSELDEFVSDVAARIGTAPELKRLQRGGPKVPVSELTATEQEQLREMYAEDYAVFGERLGQRPREDAVRHGAAG